MKKNKKSKKNKDKKLKNLIIEKEYEESKEKKEKIEEEINELLDSLSIEELTELEQMGDFSKEAIEWIRQRKRKKIANKEKEDFIKRTRVSDEIIRRTILVGKILGFKNGQYKPKNSQEAEQLTTIIEEQDIVREERERAQERGDTRSKAGGRQKDKDAR